MILFCITGTLGILCLLFCRKSSCVLGCLIWIVCSFYLVVVFLFYSLHRACKNLFLLASIRILVGRFVYVYVFFVHVIYRENRPKTKSSLLVEINMEDKKILVLRIRDVRRTFLSKTGTFYLSLSISLERGLC